MLAHLGNQAAAARIWLNTVRVHDLTHVACERPFQGVAVFSRADIAKLQGKPVPQVFEPVRPSVLR